MFIRYQLGDVLSDFPNGRMTLVVGFLKDFPKMIVHLLSDGPLRFQPFPHLFLEVRNSIVHPMLNGGVVKELGVYFSFFEPVDSRFLSPKGFFLVPSFLQLSC